MIPQDEFLKLAFQTFDMHAIKGFREYLGRLPGMTKWMIASDYCLHEKNRPYDSFAFTLIPYDRDFDTLKSEIQEVLRRDIKKTKDIDEDITTFLTQPRFFHFAFRNNKDRQYFTNGAGTNPLQVARESIQQMVKDFPEDGDGKRRLKALQQKAQAKNFNVDLLSDQVVASMFFIFICVLLLRESKPQLIGWFSDRDSMTTFNEGFMFDMANISVRGVAEKMGFDTSGVDFYFAGPDEKDKNPMWFDALVRLADYFAATVAEWDTENNAVKTPKFVPLIENTLADQPNVVVLNFELQNATGRFGRIHVTAKPPGEAA